jgi:hypothetical protein
MAAGEDATNGREHERLGLIAIAASGQIFE